MDDRIKERLEFVSIVVLVVAAITVVVAMPVSDELVAIQDDSGSFSMMYLSDDVLIEDEDGNLYSGMEHETETVQSNKIVIYEQNWKNDLERVGGCSYTQDGVSCSTDRVRLADEYPFVE